MANRSNMKALTVAALLLVLTAAIALGIGAYQSPPAGNTGGAIVESPNARQGDKGTTSVVKDAPAMSAAEGVAVTADFASGTDGWQVVQAPRSDVAANWVANEGRLQIWGDLAGNPSSDPTLFVNSSATLADGTLEAHVLGTGGEPLGLVFRGSDAGYYRLDLFPATPDDRPKAILQRFEGDNASQLAAAQPAGFKGYATSTWHLVSVTVSGSSIKVAVDGSPILEATDSTFAQGWTGVWATAGFGAQFDNVRVLKAASR